MGTDFLEATAARLLSLADHLRNPSSDRDRVADILCRISQSLKATKPCESATPVRKKAGRRVRG